MYRISLSRSSSSCCVCGRYKGRVDEEWLQHVNVTLFYKLDEFMAFAREIVQRTEELEEGDDEFESDLVNMDRKWF